MWRTDDLYIPHRVHTLGYLSCAEAASMRPDDGTQTSSGSWSQVTCLDCHANRAAAILRSDPE